ncbi:DUF6443 domain-containing protein [Haliscomenobacter sp.]|uniref:RHS repeat domain-containing protein n=1 Tax=Haliscomenobacter sp. TaxID=2717303 RepID=UPI003364E1EE
MSLYKSFSRIFLLSALTLSTCWLLAQPINNLVKDVVMPTPNATAFGKYVDIPVSYNTGVPNISIPIHTIQEGPLTIPVGLSYHASGVKVGELASWVGLGWNLAAGGMISRTVMSAPDEKTSTHQGYYKKGVLLNTVNFSSQANLGNMVNGYFDTEPDMFTFSMPGFSGKFYSNGNEGFTLTNRQDVKINVIYNDSSEEFDGFVITAPDGTRYIFGKDPNGVSTADVICEKQRVNDGLSMRNSWYLIKIETHDRKFAVNYVYTSENYSYRSLASSRFAYSQCDGATANFGLAVIGSTTGWSYGYPGSLDNITPIQAHPYMRSDIEGQRLSEINTTSGTTKVVFKASTNRQDVDDNPYNFNNPAKELDTIKVELGAAYRCKYFVLNQSYWAGNFYPNGKNEIKRLRLNSVQEQSCTTTEPAVTIPAHTFEYETQSGLPNFLPNRLSKAVDHWGFYNAAEFNNEDAPVNVPTTEVTYEASTTMYTSPSNVNRSTNTTALKYGTLRAINYPTGGRTEFTFEANTTPDQETQLTAFNKPALNGGFYIQNCDFPYQSGTPTLCCSTSVNSATFTLTDNEISTGKVEMIVTYLNRNEGANCSDQTPAAVLTLNVYNVTDGIFMGSKQINADANSPNSTAKTNPPISLASLAQFGQVFTPNTKQYKFEITVTQGWGKVSFFTSQILDIAAPVGGLRIAQIRTQKSVTAATDDIIRTYEYTLTNGLSSGKLIRKPRYSYVKSGAAVGGGAYFNFSHILLSSDSEVPLSSAEGYHLRYERVIENFNGNGKKVYTFFIETPYNENLLNSQFPVPPVQIMASDGQLKQEEVFSAAAPNQFQAKTFYTPQVVYSQSTNKMVKIANLGVKCPGGVAAYSGIDYSIRSGIYRPFMVESTLDGIITTTSYSYDPTNRFLAPIATTVTNSDGKAYTTEYTYPQDAAGNEYTEMVNRNMIATPIQVVKKQSGQIIEGSRTSFSLFAWDGTLYNQTYNNSINNPIYPWYFERYEATWDANGTLIKTDPGADGWDLQGTILGYWSNGLPYSLRMNNWNFSEFFTWSSAGRITRRRYKDFIWDYAYYPGTQLLQSITDIDGQVTSFEYDGLARLKKTTARGGNVFTNYSYTYKDAANGNLNHITTTTTFATVNSNSLLSSKTSREYFDGLGRMLQSVKVAHSPQGQDVISGVEYDNQGRVSKEYTPYHSPNNAGQYVVIPGSHTYAIKQYYASPLNRISSVTPPDWFASTYTYGANTSADNVWLNGSSTTAYAANLLSKTEITDPDGLKSISFTDKLGRNILARRDSAGIKTADTYTLYDDKSRVTTVIPPGATPNTPGLLFQYRYNGIDQVTDKYIPDAGWISLKYNTRDLPAAVQDANNAQLGQWIATNYDDYGRPITSGFVTSIPTTITNFTIAGPFNTTSYDGTLAIERGKVKSSSTKVLDGSGYLTSTNTFDAYGRLTGMSSNNILYLSSTTAESITRTYDFADNVLSETRLHKKDANTTNDIALYHNWTYDAKGRKSNSTLRVNNGATQTISNHQYTFRDEVSELNLGGGTTNALQSLDYTYNTQGWLLGINRAGLGTGVAAALSLPVPTPGFTPGLNSPASAANVDANDLFFFDIRYADPQTGYEIPATQKKNGNISQIWYQVRGRSREAWGYTYDYLDRLKNAQHVLTGSSTSTGRIVGSYSEEIDYADARGNIGGIRRRGVWGANLQNYPSGVIDQLSFLYSAGTNKLLGVADAAPTEFAARGYNKKLNLLYLHDSNGNIAVDPRSGFKITYNHLNLPSLFEELNNSGTVVAGGKRISITYDASGSKLKKATSGGATGENYTLYYLGGIEYRDGLPESISHSEGRVYNTSSTTTASWRYEYAIRDHLGNMRLMFADLDGNGVVGSTEVLQENHYYPFGMNMEGPWLNNLATKDSRYQYNGKELNDDFGLNWSDYGARWYDASVGRWNAPDPHSDNYGPFSPYNYVLNSPLNVIDPDGNDIYLLIWFSKNGETGHAGIAIENYKTVVKKDKDGKPILDRNGKPVKEQVKDGTFTYYDLWPNKSVESDEFQSNVESDYSGGVKINSLADLKMKDPTTHRSGQVDPEGRAADGMVKLTTSFEQDEAAKKAAVTDISNFRDYNACKNNCSTFAQRLINAAIEPNISASQLVKPPIALTTLYGYKDVNVVAPNNLYNAALKVKGAQRIKGPKQAEAKPYLEYFGKSNRR